MTYHPDPRPILRRRLADLLSAFNFSQVQLLVLQETGGAHHTSHLGLRIGALHRRLDTLEAQLRRQAKLLGEEPSLPMAELSRLLARRVDRRAIENDEYYMERRLWVRREDDRRSLVQRAPAPAQAPRFRESLRRLLDSFDAPVFVASRYWQGMSANEAAVQLLGYSLPELEGKTLYELLVVNDFGSLPIVGDPRRQRELTLRRKDGRLASIRAKARVVNLSNGRAQVLVGSRAASTR